MRSPYWTILTRAPFSIAVWSVFGFNVATAAITLSVPGVPQLFTFIALGMQILVVVVWLTLAVRAQSGTGTEHH
ncbi:hypothetical protein [uncultured Leifsonia sp.]|uniref:hypothetical protein n=1 Tax=uncultured Leifsonia sp. TaxID=340359 RepID=UPI0028D4E025|nr:hypothetical protein [uncultured Leifsonia sp.]